MTRERRKNPRLDNNIPIKILQDDGDLVTQTQNISRAGVYCRVSRPLAPMTKLKVNLLLSAPQGRKNVPKKISCEGVVVRSEAAEVEGEYNVAIFFNDIPPKDADCLMNYVDTYLVKVAVRPT